MARNGLSTSQAPFQADESIMTTLRVIMDVLKSHDGSIKQLQKWLDQSTDTGKSVSQMQEADHSFTKNAVPPSSFHEPPVRDLDDGNTIPDDKSEVSSFVSSRTEYQELPSRSTLINSTEVSADNVDHGLPGKLGFKPGILTTGTGATFEYFSTPMKASIVKDFPDKPSFADKLKFDATLSSIDADGTTLGQGKPPAIAWQPESTVYVHTTPSMKASLLETSKTHDRTSIGNVSVGALQTKLNLIENQVSEWGEIMDEMSDRMAKQPSLIRKFAKESSSDKVSQSQFVDDLELLEKNIHGKVNEKLSSFDRKMIELYDDLTSRVDAKPSPRDKGGTQYATQDTAVHLSIEMETLSEQFDDQKSKLQMIEKDLNGLEEMVGELKHDVNMCRHQLANKPNDEDLVSLVAEQLLEKEEVTGWRTALREMHSALNKQSEINSSLHHSYASLDKKISSMSLTFPLHGRWRWGGVSHVYPKGHSCTNGHLAEDMSFVAQLGNSDTRTFIWDKSKPYIVVTTAGCYWVKVGAFGLKSNSPPSLQITVDEEPVALFNSSGKSPTSHKISVTSSAPKHQAPTRHRADILPWRPGSSLCGAIMLPGHSRVGICAVSTVSGTRLAVEGYLEIHKVY